jgi:UDP-N-acetylmuramoyl-L-alanyl-D-glutamate--2,6-diaminopimelate ligase
MDLRQVLRGVACTGEFGPDGIEITGVVCDSRKVRRGSLFVCIRGYTTDGHRFAAQAAGQGAAALVVDRPVEGVVIPQCVVRDTRAALAVASRNFFSDPCSRLSVTGVTGTAGKTSVSFLFRHLMEAAGRTTGLIGPVANIVNGVASFSVRATPEANDLLALLDDMASADTRNTVMEVSPRESAWGGSTGVPLQPVCFPICTAILSG